MAKVRATRNTNPLAPDYPSLMDLMDALHEERRGLPKKAGAKSKMDELLDRIETAKAKRPAYEEARRKLRGSRPFAPTA